MKLAIIIYSSDSETVWNAFRLGSFTKNKGDIAQVFLLGKGVEAENLDTEQFSVREQMQSFVNAGGEILACGTCLKLRKRDGSNLCPISTLEDLYQLIAEADRVVTF